MTDPGERRDGDVVANFADPVELDREQGLSFQYHTIRPDLALARRHHPSGSTAFSPIAERRLKRDTS